MKKALLLSLTCSALFLMALAGFDHPGQTAPNTGKLPVFLPPTVPPDTTAPKVVWSLETVPERSINYPSVGAISLYGNMKQPASIILFLSGDGGWNVNVVNMAKILAQDGQTLVAGIDIMEFYKKLQAKPTKCLYPAGDLENLSEYIQKTLRLSKYHKPVLVGYSAGATLAYALLCQAPSGTFLGGIALGFCPQAEIEKPFCEGSGKLTMSRRKDGKGFDFTDQAAPGAPLEVLHGEIDLDCLCQKTFDFFNQVPNVHVIGLPKVGHGYKITKNWLPQFKQAFQRILSIADHPGGTSIPEAGNVPVAMASVYTDTNNGLPISITPAKSDPGKPMVLFISGDGGWTGFDQQICDQLASRNLPSVGLNSQSYFWKKKTPEQTVDDLVPVIRQYLSAWNKSKMILAGYSFGANVAPFILNRLPIDLRQKVQGLVLLSPDPKGDFEIHVAGMLGQGGGPYDVAAEVRSLQNTSVLCVTGDQEGAEMQTALQGATQVHYAKIPGSHHYNNDAAKVAATILSVE